MKDKKLDIVINPKPPQSAGIDTGPLHDHEDDDGVHAEVTVFVHMFVAIIATSYIMALTF